jgi:hypothetical protein
MKLRQAPIHKENSSSVAAMAVIAQLKIDRTPTDRTVRRFEVSVDEAVRTQIGFMNGLEPGRPRIMRMTLGVHVAVPL